jgi:hypothetical protein
MDELTALSYRIIESGGMEVMDVGRIDGIDYAIFADPWIDPFGGGYVNMLSVSDLNAWSLWVVEEAGDGVIHLPENTKEITENQWAVLIRRDPANKRSLYYNPDA